MLKDKIQTELTEAVKKSDEITRSTLRQLLAAILSREKEKRYKISKEEPELAEQELAEKSNLTDEEVIEVISSENKKRKESILEFGKGKREDLVKKEKAEVEVLKKYLPEQFSEKEIKRLVKETIEETGVQEIHPVKSAEGGVPPKAEQFNRVKDMGKLMGALMPKVKGKADGGLVSKIVKELLTPKEK